MVGHSVNRNRDTAEVIDDASQVGVKVGLKIGSDQRIAVFGGEHDVAVNLVQGLRHRRNPIERNMMGQAEGEAECSSAPLGRVNDSKPDPGLPSSLHYAGPGKPWALLFVPFRDSDRAAPLKGARNKARGFSPGIVEGDTPS